MAGDFLVAVGQAVLSIFAMLMLLERTTYVKPKLALLTAIALVSLSAGLFVLQAQVGGALAALGALAWLGIFAIRGGRGGLR